MAFKHISSKILLDLDFICFCVFLLVLPVSITLSSKFLFISFALGFLKALYRKDFKWFSLRSVALASFLIFFLYIILQGIIIDGLELFFKKFDRGYAPYLVFLFTPLFFRKKRYVTLIPKAFIVGLLFLFTQIAIRSIVEGELYDREKVYEVFDLHHLYASLFILIAINHLLFGLHKHQQQSKTVIHILLLGVMIFFLMFFKSKAAIAILPVLIAYQIMIRGKKMNKLLGVVIVAVGIGAFLYSNDLNEIYVKAFDFRLQIWEAAEKSISGNYLIGYGSLHEYDALRYQHFIDANYIFLDSNFNAHNQYLTLLLKFGIIGLLLFGFSFLALTGKIKGAKGKEYVGFLLVLGIMFFVESVINRHHGIVITAVMLYYYDFFKQTDIANA